MLLTCYISGTCQIIKHEKETAFKDNIKKIIYKKDSIKAAKTMVTNNVLEVVDTIVVPKGKFKPYKTNAHASYYADKFYGRR